LRADSRRYTRSCGCTGKDTRRLSGYQIPWKTIEAKYAHLVGQRFGHLTFLKVVPRKKSSTYLWEMECDCGEIRDFYPPNVKDGKTKSCGCQQNKRQFDGFHRVIQQYRLAAGYRDYEWELDETAARELLHQDCIYCGKAPEIDTYGVTRNGIDRVDNNKGYIEGNVVPCCGECNRFKGARNADEFTAHAKRICEWQEAT
jgi:hypothetical protein